MYDTHNPFLWQFIAVLSHNNMHEILRQKSDPFVLANTGFRTPLRISQTFKLQAQHVPVVT